MAPSTLGHISTQSLLTVSLAGTPGPSTVALTIGDPAMLSQPITTTIHQSTKDSPIPSQPTSGM